MKNILKIGEINYFRGIDSSLCFSSQVILNDEHMAFYNSESGEIIISDDFKDCFNSTLGEYLEKQKLKNNKKGIYKLIKTLGAERRVLDV